MRSGVGRRGQRERAHQLLLQGPQPEPPRDRAVHHRRAHRGDQNKGTVSTIKKQFFFLDYFAASCTLIQG